MIAILLLCGLVGGGFLQMARELLPKRFQYGYLVTVATLSGLCVITAGVLTFQQEPWTIPDSEAGPSNTHGGRGALIVLAIDAAIAVGPKWAGAAAIALGCYLLAPLLGAVMPQRSRAG